LRPLEPDPRARGNRSSRGKPLRRADRNGSRQANRIRDRPHPAPLHVLPAPDLGLRLPALAESQGISLICTRTLGKEQCSHGTILRTSRVRSALWMVPRTTSPCIWASSQGVPGASSLQPLACASVLSLDRPAASGKCCLLVG